MMREFIPRLGLLSWSLTCFLLSASAKRTRSASIVSDRQAMPPPRDPTPLSVKAAAPPSTAPKSTARAKRPGGRKAQVQETLPADSEEGM